jgi:hypothetical protein
MVLEKWLVEPDGGVVIHPSSALAKRMRAAWVVPCAPKPTGGAGLTDHVTPPSVVCTTASALPVLVGTVPIAQPASAETNVTDEGEKPVGTGVGGAVVVVVELVVVELVVVDDRVVDDRVVGRRGAW